MLTIRCSGISLDGFRAIVDGLGLSGAMSSQDEADYLVLIQSYEKAVRFVDQLPEHLDARFKAADAGERDYVAPDKADNPLNAWSHRVSFMTVS